MQGEVASREIVAKMRRAVTEKAQAALNIPPVEH